MLSLSLGSVRSACPHRGRRGRFSDARPRSTKAVPFLLALLVPRSLCSFFVTLAFTRVRKAITIHYQGTPPFLVPCRVDTAVASYISYSTAAYPNSSCALFLTLVHRFSVRLRPGELGGQGNNESLRLPLTYDGLGRCQRTRGVVRELLIEIYGWRNR